MLDEGVLGQDFPLLSRGILDQPKTLPVIIKQGPVASWFGVAVIARCAFNKQAPLCVHKITVAIDNDNMMTVTSANRWKSQMKWLHSDLLHMDNKKAVLRLANVTTPGVFSEDVFDVSKCH